MHVATLACGHERSFQPTGYNTAIHPKTLPCPLCQEGRGVGGNVVPLHSRGGSMSHTQQLEWWAALSREDKARWLQCAATPEEIDADLGSTDPAIRLAAAIASVGDAWNAYRASLAGQKPR